MADWQPAMMGQRNATRCHLLFTRKTTVRGHLSPQKHHPSLTRMGFLGRKRNPFLGRPLNQMQKTFISAWLAQKASASWYLNSGKRKKPLRNSQTRGENMEYQKRMCVSRCGGYGSPHAQNIGRQERIGQHGLTLWAPIFRYSCYVYTRCHAFSARLP